MGGGRVMADSDIEALKKHKIIDHSDGRRHLSQAPSAGDGAAQPFGGMPLAAMLTPEDHAVGEAGEAKREKAADEVEEKGQAEIQQDIDAVLRTIYDPEIPVNIVDLGLIYDVAVDDTQCVEIKMTLTAPACPVAGMLVRRVAIKVGDLSAVRSAHVKLTWDPPWTPERMSEEAQLELGLL